jgi:superfamily II DNA or RNA helicase
MAVEKLPTTPSRKTLIAENERLLQECIELRAENVRLKDLLLTQHTSETNIIQISMPNFLQFDAETLKQEICGNRLTKHSSSEGKIALFHSLFNGRPDVYARQWKGKNDKPGYSPACKNEWIHGICGKPKMKCTRCEHADYLPYDTAAIERHLCGQCVIGTYPLLSDDTCAFLAIDFGAASWKKDIIIVVQVCQSLDVPHAVEISRSGNGAHFWFFFDSPISASLARNFGSVILTQAMQQHAKLSFSSYDRMFPNQDTIPKGGFGNLIALPLQKEARMQGYSQFVDDNLILYEDQWAFLSSIKRITPSMIDVWMTAWHTPPLGALQAQVEEGEKPWKHESPKLGVSDCPPVIRCTLADMLYISTDGLSDRAQNQIKRLAAFRKPLFYQAQAMRMPIWDKPRVICCAEYRGDYLCLPRGCKEAFSTFVSEYRFNIALQDERAAGRSVDVRFIGVLREEQKHAFNALCAVDEGILSATTAFGKTVIGAALIGQKRVSTLILVHRKQLLMQWQERLGEFLEINEVLPSEPKKRGRKRQRSLIGSFGAGKDARSGIVDVAIIQSMGIADEIKPFIKEYGMIIVDECHHVPAVSFENVMKQVQAKYVYGLTATPTRQDGHQTILYMYLGPIRHRVDAKDQATKRPFTHVMLPRFTGTQFHLDEQNAYPAIGQYYSQIMQDDLRNHMIVEDVLACAKEQRNCLLLSERTQHVQLLASLLRDQIPTVHTLTGGKSTIEAKRQLDALRNTPDELPLVVCATGKYIGEGFDEARLDTLFLTMPISWHGTLAQYAGRLHRLHDGKREVRVYDYIDHSAEMLERMYHKRLKGYAAIGYQVCGNQETSAINSDIIFNQASFQERFISDLDHAKKYVAIVSPYVSLRRVRWLENTLTKLAENRITVSVTTRPPSSFQGQTAAAAEAAINALHALKIDVNLREGIHQKYAVIDDSIVWYGSINLLSFGASQESIMRLISGSVARALRN